MITHRRILFLVTAAALALPVRAQTASTDPRITSWQVTPSGRYARLYENDAAKTAGTSVTTWSRGQGTQSTPSYAGVMQVSYSSDWVYLRSSGLGYHVMGPWYLNAAHTQLFANFPANQNVLYRIPRNPTVPATKTLTGQGAIGYFVDGVALFDNRDTFSYTNSSASDASPVGGTGRGDGIWNRDAYVNEGVTFDPAFAHQAGANYHYHANAPAIRYLLGDHVDYNATTKAYAEKTSAPTAHSPILGWLADGYPIYGPYGYSSPMDATSGVRRMISGYVKRDGTNGTTNLNATGRTTLPAWASRAQNRSQTLASNQYGPAVSATYRLGHYLEDYDYLGELGYTQGQHFDLDLYNGRFCVTPEFPQGTYAYFLSIETDGTPKFPYTLGRWFYGSPTGASVTSINETVTEYVRGGQAMTITATAAASGSGVSLTWNSVEGGTYAVATSSDGTTFTTLASGITSSGLSTSYTTSTVAAYYRVTLTALATYDTRGTGGLSGLNSTATVQFGGSGGGGTAAPPAIVTQPVGAAVTLGGSFTVSVVASGTAPLTYQWRKDGTAISGATSASYAVTNAQASAAGAYTVVVTNGAGSVTSQVATVTVTAGNTGGGGTNAVAPTITAQPLAALVASGSSATFSVTASGTAPLAYQWRKDGVAIAGATSASYTITNVGTTHVGDYTVVVTNAAGTATSLAAGLVLTNSSGGGGTGGNSGGGGTTTPTPTPPTARIVNLAIRARVGGSAGAPVIGFVLSGSGAGKPIVVRAIGPTLATFGLSDGLADPRLELVTGQTVLAANDNWLASDAATFASVGAFSLAVGSLDAAIVRTVAPGAYSTPISGAVGTAGVALIECYDGAPGDTSARLVNASALAYGGPGDDALVPGFVIEGTGTVRVLVRAVGPTLGSFGVAGAMSNPAMTLYRGGTVVGTNDQWHLASNAAEAAAAALAVGAFALGAMTQDAALLVSLSAGAYTASVVPGTGGAGTVLTEVYVVP